MSWDFEEYCSEETETILEAEELKSSEDPSMCEWSSLIVDEPEVDTKKVLYRQNLYDPGSGEVCIKCLGISDSTLFEHLYFNYPAVSNPGIKEALLLPEKPIIYNDDGQELYMATCKEIGQVPIRKFFQNLLTKEINLIYYCVDPKGVRAMALALARNNIVKILNLTENFLSDDACFHLGEMLMENSTLEEIILSGCKIKSTGASRLLKGLVRNRNLKILNLDKNDLGDDGAEQIAETVIRGCPLHELYLSYNNISVRGSNALAGAFETRTKFVKLDLSWNNFVEPGSTYNLLVKLGESDTIQEIDLSWNALAGTRIATGIKLLMNAPNLRHLNLSNNAFTEGDVKILITNISKAKNLQTLDLSFNPLTPAVALMVLSKMRSSVVKVKNLLLDNVYVNSEFIALLTLIQEKDSKNNFFVKYGGVFAEFKEKGPDIRELVLKRADYLSKRSKKRSIDVALIILQLIKIDVKVMAGKDFTALIRASGAHVDMNLIDSFIEAFGDPGTKKNKNIDIVMVADYVKRLWPDKKLPPTPPPEPEPEIPTPAPIRQNRKDKKKKR